MIYVLVTVGFKNEEIENENLDSINLADDLVKVIKIGFSSDEINKNRLKTHSTSNFAFKIFKIIEGGTQADETIIHRYFKPYQHLGRREVFEYRDEIIDFFNKYTTIEEIRKAIPIECNENYITEMKKTGDVLEIPVSVAINILSKKSEKMISRDTITEVRKMIYLLDDYKNGSFKNICDFLEVDEDIFIEEMLNFLTIRQNLINKYKNLYDNIKKAETVYDRLLEIGNSNIEEDLVFYLLNAEDWIYLSLGKNRLRSLGYHTTKIKRELDIMTFDLSLLKRTIYSEFREKDRISKYDLKKKLANIYNKIGYQKLAKANDIEDYFIVKSILLTIDKKKVAGFELVKRIG